VSRVAAARLRRIYDSRGQETVEATVRLADGSEAKAGAPSGASTGVHEVRAFPEGGVATVLARAAVPLERALTGAGEIDQAGFDAVLHRTDGTPDLSRIGGNTATALSVAFALASARSRGVELESLLRTGGAPRTVPAIVGNCLNGGRHAIGGPEFQEFHAFAPSEDPARSVPAALAVHREVGEALKRKFPNAALGRGDEGGWVAPVTNLEGIEILTDACRSVSERLGTPVHPGLDLAASEFFRDGRYRYRDRALEPEAQVAYLAELVDRFDLRYVEDPFDQEAFGSFAELNRQVGDRTLLVGDDLYTTRVERLERGLAARSTNAILIKVNQVGTLTETLRTVEAARAHGLQTVTSHRSGEVPEGWLAQLALGTGAAGLKCGLLGGERVAKLNELLRVAAPTGAPLG
jgi:enolase